MPEPPSRSWLRCSSTGAHRARPSMSGISAPDPVATTTAFRATSSSPSPAPPSTTTRRSPSSRPRPRTSVTPCSSSHGSWPESSRFEITSSRRASTAGTSIGPIESPATRSTSRLQLDGTQQCLRGHAGVERALATDEPILDDRDREPVLPQPPGRDLAGHAGPHHHHVELAHGPSRRLPDARRSAWRRTSRA